MPAEILIVANPVSGSHAAPQLATRAVELLTREGKRAELKLTTAPGDAGKIARDAARAGVPVIAGCGGDGTLQEIATALEGSPAAMGVLPGGRCNDFARALGLSKRDAPEKLARILATGRRRQIDLGAAGGKRFLTVATLGFDSDVDRFVATRKLWFKGTPAYMYGALRVLLGFRFPQVKLQGDFGVIDERILLAATGNTACYGGALRIAPGAKADDGKFQLCVVRQVSKLAVLRIFPRVMKGSHTSHPAVRLAASSYVEIQTPGAPLWVCADGEALCQTPCRLEVRPGALAVMVK